jgi:hypothetical protein
MSCRVLRGEQGDFWFTLHSWAQVLDMANLNGWIPAKTKPPEWPVDNEEYNRMVAESGGRVEFFALENDEGEEVFTGYLYPPGRWHGGYLTAERQRVTAEDARQMAEALEEVLEEVPERDQYGSFIPRNKEERVQQVAQDDITFDEWFSGPAREHLRKFIEFCRAGEFIVLDEYKAEEKGVEKDLTE